MKKFRISIVALILCFLVGATGLSASSRAPASAETARTYNFVFVCPNKSHEYWTPIIEGMKRADERQGSTTEIVGADSYDNWSENLVSNMDAVLNRADKPDGIIVRGGVSGLKDRIDKAVEMGIPVVTVDSDEDGSRRTAYFGSDYTEIGKKSAQAIVYHLAAGTEVAMVMSSRDESDVGYGIRRAFESVINDYGMSVVDTAYLVTNDLSDPVANAAKQKTDTVAAIKTMLQARPSVTAMFTTGAVNAAYAAQAVKELGRSDILIIGQDDIEDNLDCVRDGTIHAVTAQRTDLMGYLSVINLKRYIDTGALPKTVYDTGVTLVTLENIDTYKNFDSILDTTAATVRVGYYDDGEYAFQNGFSDDTRKSGYAYEYYQMLASFAGWKYEYVYGSKAEIRKKLADGEIDIMAGAYKPTGGAESAFDFSALDMGLDDGRYFAVKKGNADLLGELDYAMAQIASTLPVFTLELYQKYYSQASVLTLTDREEQWLLGKNVLRFGYARNLLPYSDADENGKPIGLAGELIDQLADFTDIEITPVLYDTYADLEKALENNDVDLGFPARRDLWAAESKGLQQTISVITDRMMLIYHGAYSSAVTKNIAVSKMSLALKDYFDSSYPGSHLNEYESFLAMFDAVAGGSGECIIGYSSILQRILSGYDDADRLNISYLDDSEELCISVNRDNGVLTVILNKMIDQINREVITGTLLQYASISDETTFGDFFKKYADIFVIILIAIFLVLAATFGFYIYKTREHNKEQAEMQASLQKAVEVADSANKAKTDFLSSMSHDIRTPMNAIIGMTDIAKKHTDDAEKLNDCLDKITLSSQHLLTLINDILDISKIESGKLALSPVNFSLCKVVDNLVNIVRPMIKSKHQELDVHVSNVDAEVLFGDELRISQVLINILSNAVKYTSDGGKIILDLDEERLDDKTVRLTYVVKDTGIGMSPEYMEHMYDPFSRATDSRTNKIQGTGLGLAIVRQMVLMMNGTIDCESELDKGTTFTVKIDLPIGEDNGIYTLPPVDILVVDDDEVFLSVTENVINEMGAKAETATCGAQALELVKARHKKKNDYSVVIVDWKMPEMSGLDTVHAIRKVVGEKTSIILVSAYDWSDIEDKAKSSGADGFISKPLFKSYLSDRIGRILDLDRAAGGLSENDNNDLKGLHVLVAEDNELNWEVIVDLLDMYEITAERAENGKIAVDMMEAAPDGKFDLVFMDVQMPVMNGKEASAAIRQSERDYVKNIPIIAMTADAFAEDIAACLAAGMNEHISKPVDMDKVCQAIRKVLFSA